MITRRTFVMSSLASTAIAAPLYAAYAPENFEVDIWRSLRNSEARVVFNFRASWSHTCDIKAELLDSLIAQNPSYRALDIVEVDWDTFGPSQMAERLKIQRQSTLIALRGRTEIARVENQPFENQLRAFLDTALRAG